MLKQNEEFISRIPWVRKLDNPTKCRVLIHAPASMIFSNVKPRANQRSTNPEDYRCKNTAWWHFTASRKSWAQTGDYCWSHLIYRGLYGDMDEEARTEKHLKEIGYGLQESNTD